MGCPLTSNSPVHLLQIQYTNQQGWVTSETLVEFDPAAIHNVVSEAADSATQQLHEIKKRLSNRDASYGPLCKGS